MVTQPTNLLKQAKPLPYAALNTAAIGLEVMADIHIIVGTVMGTALEVAQAMSTTLRGLGHNCRIDAQFERGQLAKKSDELILICTSSTGMGDLPASIAPLLQHLTNDLPDIADRRYGIVSLGDSSYPNFAQAGKTLDEAMADIGAVRVGEPCVLDAIYVDDPIAEAQVWARQWEQLI